MSLDPRLEGLIVPSKFYGIAAVGRDDLYRYADWRTRARDRSSQVRIYVSQGDGEGLVDRILEFAGNRELSARAREAFEAH